MNLQRDLIQIVEIDVERCGLTYGSSPCAAVLGTSGVRKCYNTRFTCQDALHFNSPAEPSSGPDRSYSQGDLIDTSPFDRDEDFSWALDVTLPTVAVDAVMFEIGGQSGSLYLGLKSDGTLVYRAGKGNAFDPPDGVRIDADVSAYLGRAIRLYGNIDVNADRIRLYLWDNGNHNLVELGDDTSVSGFTVWSNSADGGVGYVEGNAALDESETPYPDGLIGGLRVFDATVYVPSDPDRVETLRFAQNISGIPRASRVYPALAGMVKTSAGRLNLGGVSERTGPLGKRERVTVRLKDFTDSDMWFDRYQSERITGAAQTDEGGYNPATRGTFFSKLRRRWPYYIGRPLRILEGEVGQALGAMRTRHYVITEWKGPDAAGNVEIIAKDVLDLADNKKALCPAPSQGKLGAAITASGGSFDLVPEGIGSDYSATGRASIGSEIVSYTRSGDTITLTGRGLDGSEAATHSEGDLFQQAYHVSGEKIANVASDLLTTYADIDAGFIPISDWTDEADRWLAGFNLTATIAKPTGVSQLLGELAQFGVLWWWDNTAQEIKMRPNRPLDVGETAPDLTDAATFLEGSTDNKDLHDERLSRVLYWHGVLDAADSAQSGENYRKVNVAIDPEAESATEYNQTQVLEIFNRWLGPAGDDGIAQAAAARLLNRYRNTPRQISFTFDAKDVDNVVLAAPVLVTSRLIVDETGASLPTQMQVTSIEEEVPGHRLKATAQDYQFAGRYGFITDNARPDYGASSAAQIENGCYIVGPSLVFSDGTGPYLMF